MKNKPVIIESETYTPAELRKYRLDAMSIAKKLSDNIDFVEKVPINGPERLTYVARHICEMPEYSGGVPNVLLLNVMAHLQTSFNIDMGLSDLKWVDDGTFLRNWKREVIKNR